MINQRSQPIDQKQTLRLIFSLELCDLTGCKGQLVQVGRCLWRRFT